MKLLGRKTLETLLGRGTSSPQQSACPPLLCYWSSIRRSSGKDYCSSFLGQQHCPMRALSHTHSNDNSAELPYDAIERDIAHGNFTGAMETLGKYKKPPRQQFGTHALPLRTSPSADYYRALIFLHRDGDALHARQALIEHMRLFYNNNNTRPPAAAFHQFIEVDNLPSRREILHKTADGDTSLERDEEKIDLSAHCKGNAAREHLHHRHALKLLWEINETARPFLLPPVEIEKEHPLFYMLADALLDHTMLTWTRLFGLYMNALRVLGAQQGVEHPAHGDFVECGTAGGGSAVLLAVVLAHFDSTTRGTGGMRQRDAPKQLNSVERAACPQRRVYCCDTFTGMPAPDDTLDFIPGSGNDGQALTASSSAWGEGTCAAPASHVYRLAQRFGVEDRITLVPGLFEETLPQVAKSASHIALLHCDADWYASTKCVLHHLWPCMATGGIMQVDDYYYWSGCRRAVEEYREQSGLSNNMGADLANAVNVDGNAVYFVKHKGRESLPLP